MANQMRMRSVVIGSARRAQQVDGVGGELVDGALGREMGLGRGQPRRRGLVGLRRQRLHQLDRLGDVAGMQRLLRRARAWPRSYRPARRRRGAARPGRAACPKAARRRNRRPGRRPSRPWRPPGTPASSAVREATPVCAWGCRAAMISLSLASPWTSGDKKVEIGRERHAGIDRAPRSAAPRRRSPPRRAPARAPSARRCFGRRRRRSAPWPGRAFELATA